MREVREVITMITTDEYILLSKDVMNRVLDSDILTSIITDDSVIEMRKDLKLIKVLLRMLVSVEIRYKEEVI